MKLHTYEVRLTLKASEYKKSQGRPASVTTNVQAINQSEARRDAETSHPGYVVSSVTTVRQ